MGFIFVSTALLCWCLDPLIKAAANYLNARAAKMLKE